MEQQLWQLGGFASCVPGRSEVSYAFPLLVASGPGEDVIVKPLTLSRFLDLFKRRGVQHHLAGLRVLGGALIQMKAFVCEVYLAAQ